MTAKAPKKPRTVVEVVRDLVKAEAELKLLREWKGAHLGVAKELGELKKEVEKLRAWQQKYSHVRNSLVKEKDAALRRAREAERLSATWRLYAKRLETHVKGPVVSLERGFVKANADAAPAADHAAWMAKMK